MDTHHQEGSQTTHGPQLRRSVFAGRRRHDEMIGAVACPACHRDVPFRLQDVGGTVNCPECQHTGIRIGSTLLDETGFDHQASDSQALGVLLFPKRWQTRRAVSAGIVGLLFAAALGAGLAFTPSDRLFLNQGWFTWQAVDTAAPQQATSTAPGETESLPAAPPEITLDAVEQLLEANDLQESLVQAQVWQQMLRDFGVPDSDPRLLRLASIIRQLTERFRPQPGPPPAYLTEFRQALKELREAVIAQDVASGRKILARAQALFDAHSSALAPYSRSYLALKQVFEQLELRKEGRDKIRDLLTTAGRQLSNEQPLEAAESIATAMFLALRTPMDQQEFEERNRTVQQLHKELRFARGKRAVVEAEECHKQNDVQARDLQLQLALDLLPDLPGSRVASLLKRARELTPKKIAEPVDSARGRQIRVRGAYELALESYGRRGALVELAKRCRLAHSLLPQAPNSGEQLGGKIAELILGGLESEVGDLLNLPTRSPDVAPGLALVRGALEEATPWKATPRWKSVSAALNSKGDEVAARAIEDANKIAKQDLAAAVRLVEPACTLGGPNARKEAERLRRQWQDELHRRADLAAQEEAWSEMSSLYRQGECLEVWRLLDEFARHFPQSPRQEQVAEVRRRVRPAVDRAVVDLVKQIQDYQQEKQWPEFRESIARLEIAPLDSDQQAKLTGFKQRLEENDAEAERLFRQTKRETYRHMANPDDVLKYRAVLRTVLRLNPDQEEAGQELKRAQTRSRSLAQGFLLQARQSGPQNEKKFREYLDKALRLDPDGPSGTEARKLLTEVKSAASTT
jgi:hypothetical protein